MDKLSDMVCKFSIGGGRMARPRGTDEAKVIQVIKTKSLLGDGTQKDPARYIYQYWDFEGKLLATHDTLGDVGVTWMNQTAFVIFFQQQYLRIIVLRHDEKHTTYQLSKQRGDDKNGRRSIYRKRRRHNKRADFQGNENQLKT